MSANVFPATDLRYARTYFEFNRLLVSLTGNEALMAVTAMLEMMSEAASDLLDDLDFHHRAHRGAPTPNPPLA